MKYKKEIYDAMKKVYEDYLVNPNSENELIEMVDSSEPYELFKDLCNWYGMKENVVEYVYELFYGLGENKCDKGYFFNDKITDLTKEKY